MDVLPSQKVGGSGSHTKAQYGDILQKKQLTHASETVYL